MDELDRLFRKIYEDNVSGKLNDERFYKLSDGYEAEQGQLKREIEALTAEVSQADMEVTNVAKLIAVTKKYTRIDELTPEILNAFVDKIVIHVREKKDGKRTPNRHLLFLCRDCGYSHRRGNAGNGAGIYAAYYTSNRLNKGESRSKSVLLPIHIYFYPYLV